MPSVHSTDMDLLRSIWVCFLLVNVALWGIHINNKTETLSHICAAFRKKKNLLQSERHRNTQVLANNCCKAQTTIKLFSSGTVKSDEHGWDMSTVTMVTIKTHWRRRSLSAEKSMMAFLYHVIVEKNRLEHGEGIPQYLSLHMKLNNNKKTFDVY